jgi:uncharacterized protein (TIGR00369 family)
MTNSAQARGANFPPDTIAALIDDHFPEARRDMGAFRILSCGGGRAHVHLPFEPRFTRPGGTISGPTMFSLADITCYIAILGDMGAAGVDSVTTTLTINFLARPDLTDLYCECEVLRRGRRQAVCELKIYSGDARKLVAQASCTYAMPM